MTLRVTLKWFTVHNVRFKAALCAVVYLVCIHCWSTANTTELLQYFTWEERMFKLKVFLFCTTLSSSIFCSSFQKIIFLLFPRNHVHCHKIFFKFHFAVIITYFILKWITWAIVLFRVKERSYKESKVKLLDIIHIIPHKKRQKEKKYNKNGHHGKMKQFLYLQFCVSVKAALCHRRQIFFYYYYLKRLFIVYTLDLRLH